MFSITQKVKIEKIYCGRYRKFKHPKISYIFEKTLDLFIIYSKCEREN